VSYFNYFVINIDVFKLYLICRSIKILKKIFGLLAKCKWGLYIDFVHTYIQVIRNFDFPVTWDSNHSSRELVLITANVCFILFLADALQKLLCILLSNDQFTTQLHISKIKAAVTMYSNTFKHQKIIIAYYQYAGKIK